MTVALAGVNIDWQIVSQSPIYEQYVELFYLFWHVVTLWNHPLSLFHCARVACHSMKIFMCFKSLGK